MKNLMLEQQLNEQTGNKFGFKLKSALLNKATSLCFVDLFYKDGTILSQEDRINAETIIKTILPKNFNYEIKFIKNFVAEEAVKEFLIGLMKNKFPSILCRIQKVDCETENKSVVIDVNEKVYDYVLSRNLSKEIESYLMENFSENIKVVFNSYQDKVEEILDDLNEIEIYDPNDASERFIQVSDVEPLVGELTEDLANYIKDKTVPEENIVICGKVQYIKEYAFQVKSKKKEEKTESENKNNESVSEENKEEPTSERKYFKFTIEDFTGKMNCVFFANKNNLELVQKIEPNNQLILQGRLEEDKFSGGVSLRVKSISRCCLPETFEEKINYKPEPKYYRNVFPEPLEYYAQSNLFSMEDKPINEFLLNNDLVVFDFETTGLKLDGSDKIIEIGAVKVVEGKITERFMCFVDPQMHIPEESTKIHGITDSDVKGSPIVDEALADFYKFTRNCYLSGYNIIGFDMAFLLHFGKKAGYNFDNPVLDVYKLAQKYVKGTKNYKLGTIAEKLGVALDNAHRAVYDTIATAEVLLKISENNIIDPTK